LIKNYKAYLFVREHELHKLEVGGDLIEIQRNCQKNDLWYSSKIHSSVKRNSVWMLRRHFILPELKTKNSIFGFLDQDVILSKPEISCLNHELLRICFDEGVSKFQKTKSNSILFNKISHFMACIAALETTSDKATIVRWKQAFNDLLVEPRILNVWSIPLSAIDPRNGQFRELLFLYV